MVKKKTGRPTVRLRREQQRATDTRERILEAAAEEFAEHGYTGASTRRVATLANVQHPALAYHFESKEGLWRAVMTMLNERFVGMYRERLQGLRGVDSATTLRLVMEEFIRFSAQNPKFHRLMAHEAGQGGERMNWLVDHYVKEFFKLLTALIRSAQQEGRFIEGDPYHVAYLFIGAVTRTFMLAAEVKRISGRSPLTAAYIEEHISLCLRLFFREPQSNQ
jgi:TetR/AcrR family transcriptional regulator